MRSKPPSPVASLPALPAASAWLLLRAACKRPAPPSTVPVSASYRLARIDATHLRGYNAAFGFAPASLPLTYLYLLAQRAQLGTMLGGAIPFRLAGLIHLENELALQGPVMPDAALTLATALSLAPPAANGARECVLTTQASQGERNVFRCTSRYLVKRGRREPREQGQQRSRSPTSPMPSELPGDLVLGDWFVALDAGRRYAALSGDWNPIHLWSWSARLMGMKHAIIHGMHTVAMACARYEQATGETAAAVTCRFRAPVPLDSGVALRLARATGGFSVIRDGRVVVEGTIVPVGAGGTSSGRSVPTSAGEMDLPQG